MLDNSIRGKVYERLGIPFGSLKIESGNDWRMALEEIEDEIRRSQYGSHNQSKKESIGCEKAERLKQEEADRINKLYRLGTLWKKDTKSSKSLCSKKE